MCPGEFSTIDQRRTHRGNLERSESLGKIEAEGRYGSGSNDQESMLDFFCPGKWLATKRRGQQRGKTKREHNQPSCLREDGRLGRLANEVLAQVGPARNSRLCV
jgi:hypothetical protein